METTTAFGNYVIENNIEELIEEGKLEELIMDKTSDSKYYSDDKIEMHKMLCNELNDTYNKKNHDYGDSFGKTFKLLGIISAVTRITDKYNRLVELSTKPEEERKVQDETIEDTLLDMANYCMMTVIELRRNKYKNYDSSNDWLGNL